jgi:hypothetical protein
MPILASNLVAISSLHEKKQYFWCIGANNSLCGSVGREITQNKSCTSSKLAWYLHKCIEKPWLCNLILGRISKIKPCQILQEKNRTCSRCGFSLSNY